MQTGKCFRGWDCVAAFFFGSNDDNEKENTDTTHVGFMVRVRVRTCRLHTTPGSSVPNEQHDLADWFSDSCSILVGSDNLSQ
jgi:hypothetical protein